MTKVIVTHRCHLSLQFRAGSLAFVDVFTHYTVDTKISQFTVQAFASGLISAVAHSPKIAIREWVGEVQFVPETLQNASFQAKVKPAHWKR